MHVVREKSVPRAESGINVGNRHNRGGRRSIGGKLAENNLEKIKKPSFPTRCPVTRSTVVRASIETPEVALSRRDLQHRRKRLIHGGGILWLCIALAFFNTEEPGQIRVRGNPLDSAGTLPTVLVRPVAPLRVLPTMSAAISDGKTDIVVDLDRSDPGADVDHVRTNRNP